MGGNPFVSFNFNFNFIFLLVFVLVLFQFLITIRGRRVLNQHRSTTGRCRSTLHHEHRSPLHCVDRHSYQTAGMTWFSLLNFYSFYLFTSSDWITLGQCFLSLEEEVTDIVFCFECQLSRFIESKMDDEIFLETNRLTTL